MGFFLDGKVHSLATPTDFLRFPLPARPRCAWRLAWRPPGCRFERMSLRERGSRGSQEDAVERFFDPLTSGKVRASHIGLVRRVAACTHPEQRG